MILHDKMFKKSKERLDLHLIKDKVLKIKIRL